MRYDLRAFRLCARYVTQYVTPASLAKATEGKNGCNREGKGRQSHGMKVAISKVKRMRKAKAKINGRN